MVMATKSVQNRLNQQRIDLGLPTVDYSNLQALEPPQEILHLSEEAQRGSEFQVDELALNAQASEAEAVGESGDLSTAEHSREAMFVDNVEKAKAQNRDRNEAST